MDVPPSSQLPAEEGQSAEAATVASTSIPLYAPSAPYPSLPVAQDEPTELWSAAAPAETPEEAQQFIWPSRSSQSKSGDNGWSAGANWNDQQGRRSLLGLFVGMGIVILLVSVVAVIALVQVFSLGSVSTVVHHTQPLIPQSTVTALPSPTATATATPLPATPATFVGLDTTTQGNWQSAYGKQGAIVIGDTQTLPAAIQVTPASESAYTWVASTSDGRAPQKISNPADRIAACWYSSSTFTVDINITDGKTYQFALYLLDWDQQNRAETVNLMDPATGSTLDTHNVQSFASGQYLVWTIRGHVSLQVTNNTAAINAVVSGLFFSSAA